MRGGDQPLDDHRDVVVDGAVWRLFALAGAPRAPFDAWQQLPKPAQLFLLRPIVAVDIPFRGGASTKEDEEAARGMCDPRVNARLADRRLENGREDFQGAASLRGRQGSCPRRSRKSSSLVLLQQYMGSDRGVREGVRATHAGHGRVSAIIKGSNRRGTPDEVSGERERGGRRNDRRGYSRTLERSRTNDHFRHVERCDADDIMLALSTASIKKQDSVQTCTGACDRRRHWINSGSVRRVR